MNVTISRAILALGLAVLLAATAGCGKVPSLSSLTGGAKADQPKEPAGMKAVSPTPPAEGPALARVETFPNLPIVPGEGDCAPRYANGRVGACINSKPCRGVGMRAATGAVACRCWAREGGCADRERCDTITKSCVPDAKDDSGRGETD